MQHYLLFKTMCAGVMLNKELSDDGPTIHLINYLHRNMNFTFIFNA